MNRNNKKNNVVAMILVGALLLIMAVLSIRDLATKSNVYKTKVIGGTELFTYTKTYSFIPVSKEHFYLVENEDEEFLIVRADKSWYEKNFDSDGYAKGNYVEIEGKEVTLDSDEKTVVRKDASQLDIELISETKAYDVSYKKHAIISLISILVIILVIVAGRVISKKNENIQNNKAAVIIYDIVVFASIVFALLMMFKMF